MLEVISFFFFLIHSTKIDGVDNKIQNMFTKST